MQEWGGIAYALGGLDAALGEGWELVPLVKVGSDLAVEARRFVGSLRRVAEDAAPIEVPYANDRVELRYMSEGRWSEVLHGGVPGWSWAGLQPLVGGLDALYINLISGSELDLETAQLLRQHFTGPIYCDLHSLPATLSRGAPRASGPIPDLAAWCACFDMMQVNEEEMALMAPDPMALAATALAAGVECLTVTVGARGAIYFAPAGMDRLDLARRRGGASAGRARPGETLTTAPIRTALVPAAPTLTGEGDATGCGDVWGATYYSRLLTGDNLAVAMRAAHLAAARNLEHRGTTGLAAHLRGELGSP